MPMPFSITITHKTTGATENAKGEFPDEEWQRLLDFRECFLRLARCRLAASQGDLHWKVEYTADGGVRHEVTLPPDDDIDAFLHRMRPFVLVSEPTSFYTIRSLLSKHLDAPTIRKHLDDLKDRYNGKRIGFNLSVNDSPLLAPQAIEKWLNAFEYHRDGDKRADLSAMFEVFPEGSARALFLYGMLERAAAVEKLASLIGALAGPRGAQHDLRV